MSRTTYAADSFVKVDNCSSFCSGIQRSYLLVTAGIETQPDHVLHGVPGARVPPRSSRSPLGIEGLKGSGPDGCELLLLGKLGGPAGRRSRAHSSRDPSARTPHAAALQVPFSASAVQGRCTFESGHPSRRRLKGGGKGAWVLTGRPERPP